MVDKVSRAVGMELGLKKYAVAHIQEGELTNGGIISLSNSRKIKPASETDPYKYLGVLQVFDADQEATRLNHNHICGG